MNKFTYSSEIAKARHAIIDIREFAETLSDSKSKMEDFGDIANAEADLTVLRLAADLIERTLPTP